MNTPSAQSRIDHTSFRHLPLNEGKKRHLPPGMAGNYRSLIHDSENITASRLTSQAIRH